MEINGIPLLIDPIFSQDVSNNGFSLKIGDEIFECITLSKLEPTGNVFKFMPLNGVVPMDLRSDSELISSNPYYFFFNGTPFYYLYINVTILL